MDNKNLKDTSWEKFMDGSLDLKTAFWGYGFFGSIIIGVSCGILAETVNDVFNIVYVISIVVLIVGLWQCAGNYKKNMIKKKTITNVGNTNPSLLCSWSIRTSKFY